MRGGSPGLSQCAATIIWIFVHGSDQQISYQCCRLVSVFVATFISHFSYNYRQYCDTHIVEKTH